MNNKQISTLVLLVVVVFFFAAFGSRFIKTIDAGHVGVAKLFGKVIEKPFDEGLHFVNPLYQWEVIDARRQSHMEKANVPSQDQLQTSLEVSVQYRVDGALAAEMIKDVGNADAALQKLLVPKLRSQLREQGKSIKRAEDFFMEETQERLQSSITDALKTYLGPKGLEVDEVLIRQIDLPPFIMNAIERKKEREQEVEQQKAELERFTTEQQQKVVEAQAQFEAAELKAQQVKVLADAQAYEIKAINAAIEDNPVYVQLQALKALEAISKDPASKVYFLNGDSPSPLPLMHIGETVPAAGVK